MKKLRHKFEILLFCSIVLAGCSLEQPLKNEIIQVPEQTTKEVKKESQGQENPPLVDNHFLYEGEDTSVITMYLTVRKGNQAEGTAHTWKEVNAHSVYYYEDHNIERYKVEGILQIGDGKGPKAEEFGYGVEIPNSIVSIRGQTSSRNPVKSYKISLKEGKGNWREQKIINLNKHVQDGLRFRNKLAYDLMKELPGMVSLQTQFVHLYVKDQTEGENSKFVDYGLYTQVEQPNKAFLRNHGFDIYGHLYKINSFEFFRYEDIIKLKSDKSYNEKDFEKLLEIQGDDDHRKLISMLEDVNDYSKPIEEVFSKWFEEENFFSWMAFHILMGNNDVQNRNTLLYSPLNVNCFYFISWDNDVVLRWKEEEVLDSSLDKGWEYGVSNYWGNVLFRRVLKSDKYREILNEKIKEFRKRITAEKIEYMVEQYDSVVGKYRNSFPDKQSNPLTNEEYQRVCEGLSEEVEKNYENFVQSQKNPMPFYIDVPYGEGGKMKYNWEIAYDFNGETITYEFQLAKDYTFKEPLMKKENLIIPEVTGKKLEPGQYFVRVLAKNQSQYEQYAFDYYVVDDEKKYGVMCFYILEDGSIVEDYREE